MTNLAAVGFNLADIFYESTDLEALDDLTKDHTPVGLSACFEGQKISSLQTVFGVIDFQGGYTDEVRGPVQGSEA